MAGLLIMAGLITLCIVLIAKKKKKKKNQVEPQEVGSARGGDISTNGAAPTNTNIR